MLTVEYLPGGASLPHRHDAEVFVYVLEGSVVMQVDGQKAVTLGPARPFTKDRRISIASPRTRAPPSRRSSWCSSSRIRTNPPRVRSPSSEIGLAAARCELRRNYREFQRIRGTLCGRDVPPRSFCGAGRKLHPVLSLGSGYVALAVALTLPSAMDGGLAGPPVGLVRGRCVATIQLPPIRSKRWADQPRGGLSVTDPRGTSGSALTAACSASTAPPLSPMTRRSAFPPKRSGVWHWIPGDGCGSPSTAASTSEAPKVSSRYGRQNGLVLTDHSLPIAFLAKDHILVAYKAHVQELRREQLDSGAWRSAPLFSAQQIEANRTWTRSSAFSPRETGHSGSAAASNCAASRATTYAPGASPKGFRKDPMAPFCSTTMTGCGYAVASTCWFANPGRKASP